MYFFGPLRLEAGSDLHDISATLLPARDAVTPCPVFALGVTIYSDGAKTPTTSFMRRE